MGERERESVSIAIPLSMCTPSDMSSPTDCMYKSQEPRTKTVLNAVQLFPHFNPFGHILMADEKFKCRPSHICS